MKLLEVEDVAEGGGGDFFNWKNVKGTEFELEPKTDSQPESGQDWAVIGTLTSWSRSRSGFTSLVYMKIYRAINQLKCWPYALPTSEQIGPSCWAKIQKML